MCSQQLEGPAGRPSFPLNKSCLTRITEGRRRRRRGEVTLRFGIVPLRVDALGESIVVDGETFMLSGHVEGRSCEPSGRPITGSTPRDASQQLMNVSSVGETTIVVRAEAKLTCPCASASNAPRICETKPRCFAKQRRISTRASRRVSRRKASRWSSTAKHWKHASTGARPSCCRRERAAEQASLSRQGSLRRALRRQEGREDERLRSCAARRRQIAHRRQNPEVAAEFLLLESTK